MTFSRLSRANWDKDDGSDFLYLYVIGEMRMVGFVFESDNTRIRVFLFCYHKQSIISYL